MSYKFTPASFGGETKSPQLLRDLLALDASARPFGCGLHPRLRALLAEQAADEIEIVAPPVPSAAEMPILADMLKEKRRR